jgi:hypothetical protein
VVEMVVPVKGVHKKYIAACLGGIRRWLCLIDRVKDRPIDREIGCAGDVYSSISERAQGYLPAETGRSWIANGLMQGRSVEQMDD